MKTIYALLIATALTGCAVGPDYKTPDSSVPDSWFGADKTKPATDAKAAIDQQWWQHFGDPVLIGLIDKAASGNFDLKIAEARIAEARAARGTASSDLLPTVNIVGGQQRQANRIAFPGPIDLSKPFNTYQAGFDASWEPDLFGGKRRALEASTADLEAAQASRDDIRVSLLAEVARTYVDIRGYQQQIAITNETVDAAKHTVGIINENYKAGKTPELDLMQAKAEMEQMLTQLPYFENLQAQAEYSMDLLLGEQPGATHSLIGEKKPVPAADKNIVLAAPAAVIANRPDIRVAERQLASATAEKGVAVAQFFPDISLSGFVGLLNVDAGSLFKSGSKSWAAGGNVLLPILNYGKLSSNLDAADARQQGALATYQKSVLSALSDVAKSVTAYSKQQEYREATFKTVQDNRKTASIAHTRYKEGLSSFIDVLDAERTLYASQSKLVQADAQTAQDQIAVYKSLGGGWQAPEAPKEATKAP